MIAAFDYRPTHRRLQTQIAAAISRVLASGQLILGPEVQAFEREFAAFLGVAYAVGVNSGTDALSLALRALGVGWGDEVITVANAGVAPVAAIRAVGAIPKFVDVCPNTLLMDPARIPAVISTKTKAILPIHLYGQAVDMTAIVQLGAAYGLPIIEDCSQAHGATYQGKCVGGYGILGCFSFYPTKNLGAYGDGGMVVTQDIGLAERLRSLRMYGFQNDRHAHCEGINSRLDELQAAILRIKLPHLSADNTTRCNLARQYLDGLQGTDVVLPQTAPERTHVYHLFVVRIQNRQSIIEALQRHHIGYGIHYPEPVHLMRAYRFLGCQLGDLPVTERACETALSLPLYPGLTPQAVEQVINIIRAS